MNKTFMHSSFESALQRACLGKQLTIQELVTLLATEQKDELHALFRAADQTRRKYVGDEVHFRGIVEFSNYCIKNCLYCGLRRDNPKVHRYRMKPEEIIETCTAAAKAGFKTIVLQAGEDPHYSADKLADIIYRIKAEHDVAITLSLGENTPAYYRYLRDAGADRYLLKHETADPGLFAYLRPGTSLEHRLNCLKHLKRMGYQTGSGNIVGLPGQSLHNLAEDILLMRKLEIDMAGIGPFIPNEHTPLAGCPQGDLDLTLKMIAITRLMLPWINLPATTALGTIHPRGREMALKCGANVIMPNVTPESFRRHYRIYPGKENLIKGVGKLESLKTLVLSMGRKISRTKGDAKKPIKIEGKAFIHV